jgi:hypothetical protein
MKPNELKPGTKVLYHGGYNQSVYTMPGIIIDHYYKWNVPNEEFEPDPELWTALLETGAYAVGLADQFDSFDELISTLNKL